METPSTETGIDVETEPTGRRDQISRKVIAAVVVAAILGTSGFYIWYEYYRHWSIKDVENAVILDEESDEFYPVMLGFRDSLDGRTVTGGTGSAVSTIHSGLQTDGAMPSTTRSSSGTRSSLSRTSFGVSL